MVENEFLVSGANKSAWMDHVRSNQSQELYVHKKNVLHVGPQSRANNLSHFVKIPADYYLHTAVLDATTQR